MSSTSRITGKALRLLQEVIALQGQTFSPERFSEKCGVPVPNLYRYLNAFIKSEILIRPRRGEYLPHPMFLASLSDYSDKEVFKRVIRPELERLANKLHIVLHFGIFEAEMVTYLIKAGNDSGKLYTVENMQLEAYCSGIGKVLLAALPPSEIDGYLASGSFPRLTTNTLTSSESIRDEIYKTKKRGYGIDNREAHEDLVCIAVPVVSSKGITLGAISASSTTVDLLSTLRADTIAQLRNCAERIGFIF